MPRPFTGPKMFYAGPNFLSQSKNLIAFMPCPFTGPKMFWASPNFLCQTKKLSTYCGRQKDDLHSVKFVFVPAQKFLKRH